jgi:hypothetical protein
MSRDIYTDSKRFIYELLQNADDASNNNGKLEIRIDFTDSYIVLSHKGEPFSEIDIESISSVGDGSKAGDENKTGFKGIGFKSVFAHSNCVIIKTGNYCFKYEKKCWDNHWDVKWGKKEEWEKERQSKKKDSRLKMPYQIIPVWTELPEEIKNLSLDNYSVSTAIKYDHLDKLKEEINVLFEKSQIVLFLRSKDVEIQINSSENVTLEKSIADEIVKLKRNGIILSEWLIKTEQFDIPEDVKQKINDVDQNTPRKLKEANKTEIAFALQLEKGMLKKTDIENRLIFTYLPTSINYDFPFLVNSSFLTDAGREHLHKDTYWNQWLFKQIPLKFFTWMVELADKKIGRAHV